VLDADWQRLWFSTLNTAWTSLAVVADGAAAELTPVAARLAQMARDNGNPQATVLDATTAVPADVPGLIGRLVALTAEGARVIVAIDAPARNPGIMPLVRATSGVLLLVQLGESSLHSSRETADVLDRARILGSIVIG
jgi:hypothetical protein